MAWLFERTIEVAAWIAMLATWVALGLTVHALVIFFQAWSAEGSLNVALLTQAGRSAGACVAFAAGLGALACVDRFIYDAEPAK